MIGLNISMMYSFNHITLMNQINQTDGIPIQENSSDCGVFTCMYMEYLSRDEPFDFTQEQMSFIRRRIIYEICTGMFTGRRGLAASTDPIK